MSKSQKDLAEVFPLGVHVREELLERKWTLEDLSSRCTIPLSRLEELLSESAPGFLTFQEAEALGYALNVSSVLLLNLQLSWLKSQEQKS